MNFESKFIKMHDNVELHTQIREVDSEYWLIATHGIGEHLERHAYLRELVGREFNLFQYDLRGHGKSLGLAANIQNFDQYRTDLKSIIDFLHERYKMKKFVLFGHSMGALITAGFVQNEKEEKYRASLVYLNAPPAGFAPPLGLIVDKVSLPIFEKVAGLNSSVRLGGLVDLNYLSHDPNVKERYINDPLNALKLHTKLLLQLAKDSKKTFSKPINPDCPAFVSWGSEDKIVSPGHLKKYFSTIEKNFEVKEFVGAYHEIHNEVEKFKLPYFDYLSASLKKVLTKIPFEENNHE